MLPVHQGTALFPFTGSSDTEHRVHGYSINKVNVFKRIAITVLLTIATQSRNDLSASSSFLRASYSMKAHTIIPWTRTTSIIVKKGLPTQRHVSFQLTYEQVCELPILLHTSPGYDLIP